LPERISQATLIVGAMGAFVLYFVLTVLAQTMLVVLLAQIARGVAIAVVGAAGLRYFQDLMAGTTGRATALFTNASTAGSLFAAVLAGVAIQAFGYRATLLLCAVTALAAAMTFFAGTRVPRPTVRPQPPDMERRSGASADHRRSMSAGSMRS
jgi:SET family sugar efflux transporter-like MFS transporter